jgi:hypothetical protein
MAKKIVQFMALVEDENTKDITEEWVSVQEAVEALFAGGVLPPNDPPPDPNPDPPGPVPDPEPIPDPGTPQPVNRYAWLEKYHPSFAKANIKCLFRVKGNEVHGKGKEVPIYVDNGKRNNNGAIIFHKPHGATKVENGNLVWGYRHPVPTGKPENNQGFPTADGRPYIEICNPVGGIPKDWLIRIAILDGDELKFEEGFSENDL